MQFTEKAGISLCMIVKDEEENLKSCLSMAAPFVDEIIVVDTGSTDSTKVIALEFTNKVYDFKWCNDFSKARNFSISKALNEYILVLDADEFVTDFFNYNVDKFINNPLNKNKVGRINIMEDSNDTKRYIERVNRFFNRNYFHYEGIIHEQLVSFNKELYNTELIDITAEHVGYTKEVLNRTNKLKRNIDLLQLAVKDNGDDPYVYFQLAKSYYMLKDYRTATVYFEKALDFQLDFRLEYVEDLIETYGYALVNSGRYKDALILENCMTSYENIADFHFLMGIIYMNNARLTEAVESFLKCTKLSYCKVDGVNTYIAYYNIGIIYDVLGFREKAVEYYKNCGDYEPALKRIRAQMN